MLERRIQNVGLAFSLWAALWAANAGAGAPPTAASASFFDGLVRQAGDSAREKYKPPPAALPDYVRDLNYDAYMRIRFRPEQGLWHGGASRFEMQFFHPGYLYREPVRIHALEEGRDHEIQFSPAMFDYGDMKFPKPLTNDLFLTGLRILYPLNQPNKMDELTVFLGNSFFRVLGAHQSFGASARGVAIDTAEPGGEEFPRFTEFWVEKPAPLAGQIRLFARLESRRIAGAYQFLIQPGETTVMEVEACLFLREEVGKLGIAPLTSMFFFGENRTQYFPDFRPEVHDSDGLLVQTADQGWQWHALANPPKVHQISTASNVVAFGLFQRDRQWDHYQDLEAHFERRPSYWIVPDGNWGPGRIELVEIPSTEERNDNIVAYWVPDQKPTPGKELRFRYQLRSLLTDPELPPAARLRVQGTRLQPGKPGTRFILDFAGGSPPASAGGVVGKVVTSTGRVEKVITQPNEMLGGWRTFFDLIPEGNKPAELRAWLQKGDQVVSETWVYHYSGF